MHSIDKYVACVAKYNNYALNSKSNCWVPSKNYVSFMFSLA